MLITLNCLLFASLNRVVEESGGCSHYLSMALKMSLSSATSRRWNLLSRSRDFRKMRSAEMAAVEYKEAHSIFICSIDTLNRYWQREALR